MGFIAEARIDEKNHGRYECVRRGSQKTCNQGFDADNIHFQIFKNFYQGYTNGFGGQGASKVTVCLGQIYNQMWDGPCWITYDNPELNNGSQFLWDLKEIGLADLEDQGFNYANYEIYVRDAEVVLDPIIVFGRTVSIDEFKGSVGNPGEANVNQEFTISWDIAQATSAKLKTDIPGRGYEEIGINPEPGNMNFSATAPGTARFTICASGPGHNGFTEECTDGSGHDGLNQPHSDSWTPGDVEVSIIGQSPPGDFTLSVDPCVGGSNQFDLSWSPSQYAETYDIYVRHWSGGSWNLNDSISGTSYTTYQPWDTDVYFKVIARNSAGSNDSGEVWGGNCSGTPSVDIKADSSDGPISISYNTAATLSWTSSNASSCDASGAWSGSKLLNDSQSTGNLTSSKTYTLTCTNSNSGYSTNDSVTVNVILPSVPIVDLKCNGSDSCGSVGYGSTRTLSWTVSGVVNSCTASNAWSGSKSVLGSETTSAITSDRTWTITCTGPGGTSNPDSVSASVPTPSADITCSNSDGPCNILWNGNTTIEWCGQNSIACANASSCSVTKNGNLWEDGLTGSENEVFASAGTYTYELTCLGDGTTSDSVTVNVGGPPVMNYFRCNGVNTNGTCNIDYNGTAAITWSSSNTTNCSLVSTIPTDEGVGPSGTNNYTNITANRNYSIECWNNISGIHAPALPMPLYVVVNGPSVDIKADNSNGPVTLNWNTSANLSWTSNNAGSCTASGDWSGSKALNSSESTGNLTNPKTYNYTLTCYGNGSVPDTVQVILNPPVPNAPSNVTVTEPDYCVSGPAATVGWTYSDPASSPQSAYQVQITDTGNFNNPVLDTGKLNSGSNAYFTGQGVLQFNTTYRARVRTWNGYDVVSAWSSTSNSWKTPSYAYPQVDFNWTANNILNNPSPPINKPVQFTDATVFNGNPNGRQWSWTFGDGGTSTVQNPSHTYTSENSYYVTLTATDNANQSCSRTKGPLMIQKPIPRWREIAPR